MQLFFDFIFLIPELFVIWSFILLIFFFSVLKITNNQTFSGTIYLIYIIKFFLLTLVFTFFLNITIWDFCANNVILIMFMTLKKSALANLFQVILLFCSIMYAFYLITYLEVVKLTDLKFEYIYIILLNIFGFLLLLLANDFLLLFFLFEFTSFGLYILISYNVVNNKALEAALKYFIFGAIISSILLFSIYLIYFSTGATNFYDIQLILGFINVKSYNFWVINLLLSVFLIFSVLLFKLGLFPFHFWPPVIYDGISYKTLIYVFSIPKISYLYLVINFYYNIFFEYINYSSAFFATIGILSVLIGSLSGLVQTKIKKLLSYSGIVNFSYILLILATTSGYDLGYLVIYLNIYLSNIFLLFFLLLYLTKYKILNTVNITYISELRALKSKNIFYCLIFAGLLFSLSGFPPFGGFFIKYLILINLALAKSYFILILFLVINIISCFYYIRLIRILFFNRIADSNFYKLENDLINANLGFKQTHTICGIAICFIIWFFFNIYFCIEPNIIYYWLLTYIY